MAVTSSKSDRIASRLIPWKGSPQNEGRIRLRGGSKGQPTREATNALDVRLAISELNGAHEMLGGADIATMTPIERRENRKAAVAKIALAARALDEILRREDEPLPDTRGVNRPARRP